MTESNALTAASPTSLAIYKQLLATLAPVGPFREEIKKTSIHLVRKSAFAGVHPRSQHLLLTIKAEKSIRSPRVTKAEQVSKSRWHLDVKVSNIKEIDGELLGWLRRAYDLWLDTDLRILTERTRFFLHQGWYLSYFEAPMPLEAFRSPDPRSI